MSKFSRLSHQNTAPIATINVVPYIDVMLVLLVIFMVVMPRIQQGVEIDLPQTSAQEVNISENLPIVISVDQFGKYYVNFGAEQNQPVKLKRLLPKVLAARDLRKGASVLIRGDANTAYAKIVEIMALLKKTGIQKVGLLTEPIN